MTTCRRRNGNHSLFNHNHHVLPAQSYVSYPDVSLSMTGSLGKDVLSDARQPEVDFLCLHFQGNRLYKGKDTKQYTFGSVKVY